MNKLLACVAVIGAFGLAVPAQAENGVKIGTLSCNERGGWGLVLGSARQLNCTFAHGDRVERYEGSMTRVGLDLGYQHSGTLVWAVVAPHTDEARGALAGHYAGATASATAIVGVGANALIGGLDRSIALQPVSVEGTTGLDVAAGIGAMTLRSDEG
ncbi:MAG TPA: DUF992 domain-containing protein [Phenylobacterium sp.]|jgi:hypothetical protein|uniref:DUF992 domain-containing protein n=1 Tax=Phenylobacterium sp. TaxID=1871053 RepID=UPI002C466E8B|nr:DUF992 domain-containing protein [Phenylobacterium sp.]HXA40858.1 DUF992 domain-containing protein [Phenylobacterium sp.]